MTGRKGERGRVIRYRKDGTTWETPSPAKGAGLPMRPPFPKGNGLGLSAGYRSPRVYGEFAKQLAVGMVEDRPDLAGYPEALAAWAQAEAQAALLRRHLEAVGIVDEATDEPRARLLTLLNTIERAAARHRATLGLDPRSEAQLARERAEAASVAVDLGALAQRGAEAIAARAAAGEVEPPDLAGEVLESVKASATPFDSMAPWSPGEGSKLDEEHDDNDE